MGRLSTEVSRALAPPGALVTARVPNDFPALPVREDANVVVTLGGTRADVRATRVELFRLSPTSRSLAPAVGSDPGAGASSRPLRGA